MCTAQTQSQNTRVLRLHKARKPQLKVNGHLPPTAGTPTPQGGEGTELVYRVTVMAPRGLPCSFPQNACDKNAICALHQWTGTASFLLIRDP